MPPYGQPPPPPLHHHPYSNPPPSSSRHPPPPAGHYRHYSDSDQPRQTNDNIYGTAPGATSAGYDPSLPTVPAGQPLPPQPRAPVTAYDPNGALLPSAAAQMAPPANYHRSSHESHRSHHSHHSHHSRPRSSSGRSHHSQTKDDKRPTLGDTLMLIWDSVRGTKKPRK